MELKLEQVLTKIEKLKAEGENEQVKDLEQEYEYAKHALENISFKELLLIFYMGCLPHTRLLIYFDMVKSEALSYQKYLSFREAYRKRCANPEKFIDTVDLGLKEV